MTHIISDDINDYKTITNNNCYISTNIRVSGEHIKNVIIKNLHTAKKR